MERDRSGKRSGAGRKLSERERSDERACEKNDGAGAEPGAGASWNGNGAVSGLNWPLKFRSKAIWPILFLNSEVLEQLAHSDKSRQKRQ